MAIRFRLADITMSKKRRPLWAFWTLIVLISVCIVTSLGQTLLQSRKHSAPTSTSERISLALDNPVFSPLMPSRSRMPQFPAGAHVIYGGDVQPPSSEGVWWAVGVTADLSVPESSSAASASSVAASGRSLRSFFPVRRSINFNRRSSAGDAVNLAVTDLLEALKERELKRQANKGEVIANPFEEAALKESSEKQTASTERTTKAADVQTTKEETKRSPEASGGTSVQRRNFVLIGSFADQLLSLIPASSDQGFLHNESSTKAFGFDIADARQYFDLNVILRSQDSQESVAFGDLNGDGALDAVVTNKLVNQTLVYLNDGQGNYTLCTGIFGGNGPAMAAIGEFSEDKSPDVAIMLQADRRIVADGKGLRKFVFLPASDIATDGYSSMLPYDFDGDGLQDLLLADYRNSSTTLYRNVGQGFFAAADVFALQTIPLLQVKSDINGDGIEDLILAQRVGNRVSIVYQNGLDGTFTSLANTIFDSSIYYAVGDFDQDGVIDIAIARLR